MIKLFKKITSLILLALIVFSSNRGYAISSDYITGDVIEFGSYPQSRVVDEALILKLNSNANSWKSYDYFYGNNDLGFMHKSDFMRYTDVVYNDTKYRGVTFSEYRPSKTSSTPYANNSSQDDNGFEADAIYWFKYEPLKWKVLDSETGFLVTESIIDSQPYNNIVFHYDDNNGKNNNDYYNDYTYSYFANDYATSSIRIWLNNDFFNTAFSEEEKEKIDNTRLDNYRYDSSYTSHEIVETYDKVFMLSYDDITKSEYGFSNDRDNTARAAYGTDYAEVQGLFVFPSFYKSSYWLMTPCANNSFYGIEVERDGRISAEYKYVHKTSTGVRPAVKLRQETIVTESDSFIGNIIIAIKNFFETIVDFFKNLFKF